MARRLVAGGHQVDGGNSYFKDDVRRARTLARRASTTSTSERAAASGAERGYCLMIGGPPTDRTARSDLQNAGAGGCSPTEALDVRTTRPKGSLHCGPAGAGHFVKMIHNGIEYGLMQSYAEGFDILRNAVERRRCPRISATTSILRRSPRSGAAAASSARGCWIWRRSRSETIRSSKRSPATSATPAKDAGPSPPRSRKTCPPRC